MIFLLIKLKSIAPLSIRLINRIIILNTKKIFIKILKNLLFINLKYKEFLDIINLLIYKDKFFIKDFDL